MIEKVSSIQFKFLGHLLIFALESEIRLIDYSDNVCFITDFITNNELFKSSVFVSRRFDTMRHPVHKKTEYVTICCNFAKNAHPVVRD